MLNSWYEFVKRLMTGEKRYSITKLLYILGLIKSLISL